VPEPDAVDLLTSALAVVKADRAERDKAMDGLNRIEESLREVLATEDKAAATRARIRAERDEALAAIARVRELHVRSEKPRVTTTLCGLHGANWPQVASATRDEIRACPDCTTTEAYVCQHCRHECPDDDEWPCGTIRALDGS
jgi:DNA-binding Lrp family transcriptional regulator